MALREGSSNKVIQDNIRCLLEKDGCGYDPPYKDPAREEYTPAQAAAIAYSKAGKRKNKAETLKGEKQTQSKQKPAEEEEKKSDNAEAQEGQMAQGDVRSIVEMAKRIDGMVSEMTDLPEWVQAKITKAQDYLSSVAGHLSHPGEDEEAEDMAEGKDHDKDGDVDSEDWKMARDKAIKGATTEAGEDSDPCWKDYEMVGMKKGKGGKPVPNCVPKSSDNAEESYSEISVPTGWSVSSNVYRD
jgi:hypothetical protein